MSELRSLCGELGWEGVQRYIQSGNLVFQAKSTPAKLETELEQAISRSFGLSIQIIVRAASIWPDYVRDNPYPDASESEPNAVMLALSKRTRKVDVVEKLQEREVNKERIVQVRDVLWLHFAAGVAKSKLSPALLDRLVGSPVTMRNWQTVLKLHELARPSSSEN